MMVKYFSVVSASELLCSWQPRLATISLLPNISCDWRIWSGKHCWNNVDHLTSPDQASRKTWSAPNKDPFTRGGPLDDPFQRRSGYGGQSSNSGGGYQPSFGGDNRHQRWDVLTNHNIIILTNQPITTLNYQPFNQSQQYTTSQSTNHNICNINQSQHDTTK